MGGQEGSNKQVGRRYTGGDLIPSTEIDYFSKLPCILKKLVVMVPPLVLRVLPWQL